MIVPKANHIKEELQLYPHVQDPKTKNDTRYNPETYISVQTKVNNDEEFEKRYIDKLISEGWVALKNIEDIKYFPKGKAFKYRLNGKSLSGAPEGTFRSGGWLIGKNLEDTENKDNYVMYKAYNGAVFSLQIKDLLEVYVKSNKRDVVVFKKPDLNFKTNFPVFLPDPKTGENIIIYYAKDQYNKNRFINSVKYRKALNTELWTFSIVFENDNNNNL